MNVTGQRLTFLILVGVDIYSKYWAVQHDAGILNHGGILGIFPGLLWMVLLPGLWLWLAYLWAKSPAKRQWPLILILSGGAGNWLSRIIFQGVVDMIHYPIWRLYGNIADIYLCLGLIWYALTYYTKTNRSW